MWRICKCMRDSTFFAKSKASNPPYLYSTSSSLKHFETTKPVGVSFCYLLIIKLTIFSCFSSTAKTLCRPFPRSQTLGDSQGVRWCPPLSSPWRSGNSGVASGTSETPRISGWAKLGGTPGTISRTLVFFFPGHAHHHHHHHHPHPHPHPPQPQPQLNHNHNNQNNHTTTTTTYDHHHNKSILPSPAKRLAQQASATLCAYSHYLLPTLPFLPTNYHTTYYVLSI